MFKRSVIFLLFSFKCQLYLTYDDTIHISDLMGCNESPDFRPLDLKVDFTHNYPKKNEVIRSRMYYIGEDPIMAINSNTQFIFGHYRVVDPGRKFAIYQKEMDWLKKDNPCVIVENVSFHRNFYTKLDIILTKSGDFTIFAYGMNGFTITCRSNVMIDMWSPIKVSINRQGQTFGRFYYDCPMLKD